MRLKALLQLKLCPALAHVGDRVQRAKAQQGVAPQLRCSVHKPLGLQTVHA
jgi:hypothetical protein